MYKKLLFILIFWLLLSSLVFGAAMNPVTFGNMVDSIRNTHDDGLYKRDWTIRDILYRLSDYVGQEPEYYYNFPISSYKIRPFANDVEVFTIVEAAIIDELEIRIGKWKLCITCQYLEAYTLDGGKYISVDTLTADNLYTILEIIRSE